MYHWLQLRLHHRHGAEFQGLSGYVLSRREKTKSVILPRLRDIPQVEATGVSGSPDKVREREVLLVKGILHVVLISRALSGQWETVALISRVFPYWYARQILS